MVRMTLTLWWCNIHMWPCCVYHITTVICFVNLLRCVLSLSSCFNTTKKCSCQDSILLFSKKFRTTKNSCINLIGWGKQEYCIMMIIKDEPHCWLLIRRKIIIIVFYNTLWSNYILFIKTGICIFESIDQQNYLSEWVVIFDLSNSFIDLGKQFYYW